MAFDKSFDLCRAMKCLVNVCIFLAATARFVHGRPSRSCIVDTRKDFTDVGALFLKSTEPIRIIYPKTSSPSTLRFDYGENVLLVCAGSPLNVSKVLRTEAILPAKCLGERSFRVDGKEVDFKDVSCQKHHKSKIRSTGKRCADGGRIYEIGFQIDSEFLRNIELCHNAESSYTYWSHGIVVASITGKQTKPRKNDFSTGSLFSGFSVRSAYKRSQQYLAFLELFDNDKVLVGKYLPQNNSDLFFAKGHLVANADEYYGAQQDGTFFFANVVPMWQQINNGNWKKLEDWVRQTAASRTVDLNVWTGGLGVLGLPGKNGKLVDIYLTPVKDSPRTGKKIPVPRILFKYIIDEESNTGIVFLTVNNPFLDKADVKSNTICKEYKGCNEHLQNRKDRGRGFTYCCLVDDFLANKEVDRLKLPQFSNVKPLL